MYDDIYIKDQKIIDKNDNEKEIELIVSILKARKELDNAAKNFEFAEEDLIDYYTYQIKANRSKLDYLIKQAKQKGLVIDMVKQLEIKYNKAI